MEDTEAENLRLRISAMDLKISETFPTHQNLATISEERHVFYDDGGLAVDIIGFESVVVVDNLPIVDSHGARELEAEIIEIFGGVGMIKKGGFSMPVNPLTLESSGYCFVDFTTRQEAELAVKSLDGHKYGTHKLSVTFYDDLHRPDETLELEPYLSEQRDDRESESILSEDEEECKDDVSDSPSSIGKSAHLEEPDNAVERK